MTHTEHFSHIFYITIDKLFAFHRIMRILLLNCPAEKLLVYTQ